MFHILAAELESTEVLRSDFINDFTVSLPKAQ